VNVSIAIATYNRADYLRLTLQSLTRLENSRSGEYEIVVVANACTDDTIAVVESFIPQFRGRLRCVVEEKQGLSHARNRAIAETRFEIVSFLDDDVEVDARWLNALIAAFQEEDCAVVGGKAYLIYPQAKPRWLGEQNEGHLSKVDLGSNRRSSAADELYGVNLSIRRSWIERVGLFRADLGRVGPSLVGDEDIDLLQRIVKAGGRLIYEPAAFVGHRVAPVRLNKRWFWKRCYVGSYAATRMLDEANLGLRSLRRASAHMVLTSGSLVSAVLRKGPRSPEAFYQSTRWVGYLGSWLGTASRLGKRFLGIRKTQPDEPVRGTAPAAKRPQPEPCQVS
jgi:glycosyltransferase involved in cell wall biosynthesis